MIKQINMVKRFHEAMGLPIQYYPNLKIKKELIELRWKLIEEELKEFKEAVEQGDKVNVSKEFADLLYVVFGGILDLGYQDLIEEVFNRVQVSNMSKLGEDGTPVLREDGKVTKGPLYKKPYLHDIFQQYSE